MVPKLAWRMSLVEEGIPKEDHCLGGSFSRSFVSMMVLPWGDESSMSFPLR